MCHVLTALGLTLVKYVFVAYDGAGYKIDMLNNLCDNMPCSGYIFAINGVRSVGFRIHDLNFSS